MMTIVEQFLMKIISFEYNITVNTPWRHIHLQPLKSLLSILTGCSVFLSVQQYLSPKIESLDEFVALLTIGSMNVVFLAALFTTLFKPDSAEMYSGIAEAIRQDMNENLKQSADPTSAALVAYKWLNLFITFVTLYLGEYTYAILVRSIGVCLCYSQIVNVAVLKHLVVKRLRAVRTMAESAAFLDQVVMGVRQVLKCNSRINCTFQALATAYSVGALLQNLRYFYKLWLAYGVNLAPGHCFPNGPIFAPLMNVMFHSSLLILVMFSSSVSDEIDEIKDELDVTMTARSCTKQQQKMISLLLLELRHKPIQFSALGLFTINRIAYVAVIAGVISYMLVFIQFS